MTLRLDGCDNKAEDVTLRLDGCHTKAEDVTLRLDGTPGGPIRTASPCNGEAYKKRKVVMAMLAERCRLQLEPLSVHVVNDRTVPCVTCHVRRPFAEGSQQQHGRGLGFKCNTSLFGRTINTRSVR